MSAPVLPSALDTSSPEAMARAAHNRALADELRARVQAVVAGCIESIERGEVDPAPRLCGGDDELLARLDLKSSAEDEAAIAILLHEDVFFTEVASHFLSDDDAAYSW